MGTESHTPRAFDRALRDELLKVIRSGGQLRRCLPPWGRIHIDRHLPFLCVYRRPPVAEDPGTARLLYGEAAYLLAPGDPRSHEQLTALIRAIISVQHEHCGSFVMLEIWADNARPEVGANSVPPAAGFRLLAPRSGAPVTTLEVLEQVLLRIRLRNQPAAVAVEYGKKCAPPGMKPLLTAAQQKALSCVLLGVAVNPVYRDPDSDELHPFALRTIHHGLSLALKRGIFEYLRSQKGQQPAHFLELGRRAMTRAVWESDRRLAAIGDQFDLLLHVTPVNSRSAWYEFKRRHYQRPAEFHYRPRTVDPALLKRELYRIPLEHIEDPTLSRMFEEKRQELDRKLGLLGDRGRPEFLYGSMQVYGIPDATLLATARHILQCVPPHTHDDRRSRGLDAQAFAREARRELAHYRKHLPKLPARVEVRDDVAGLIVSRGHLLVGSDTTVGAKRVDASIQHEVGTHLVTYYNGLAQPLRQLHVGLAGYDETQEGLAVLSEYLVSGLSRPRLRILAGRVLAVDCLAGGADFVSTFRYLMQEHGFGGYQAYSITMRVYRGGGLTKDVVYLRGFMGLLAYLAGGGSLEILLLGKFALRQVPWIEELHWRRVLKAPVLRPRYLEAPASRQRLQQLQKGLSLEELVEEIAA